MISAAAILWVLETAHCFAAALAFGLSTDAADGQLST
jgi:hypothetical protein